MTGLLRPQDLKQIASDAEVAKMDEERRLQKKSEQQKQELREAFMAREVQPEAIERINRAIRIAAEHGQHQLQVLTFPSTFCSDGGRRINIGDPAWPSVVLNAGSTFTSTTSYEFGTTGRGHDAGNQH